MADSNLLKNSLTHLISETNDKELYEVISLPFFREKVYDLFWSLLDDRGLLEIFPKNPIYAGKMASVPIAVTFSDKDYKSFVTLQDGRISGLYQAGDDVVLFLSLSFDLKSVLYSVNQLRDVGLKVKYVVSIIDSTGEYDFSSFESSNGIFYLPLLRWKNFL